MQLFGSLFGLLLAAVGLFLALTLMGVKVETKWLKMEWQEKPPVWVAWPFTLALLAGGIWLFLAVQRDVVATEATVDEAMPSNSAEAGNRLDSNTAVAAPAPAGEAPLPAVGEKSSGSRAEPASAVQAGSQTAIAENGSSAWNGNMIGSTVTIGDGGNRSEQQP
jgi:hypothetical protein